MKNILLLIAGVLDPKWPVDLQDGALPAPAPDRLVLSPFDEAALELALQIRDRDPDVSIRAIVAGGGESEKLCRIIAAHKISDVARLSLANPWDQAAVARQIAFVAADAGLILMGQEFGDFDEGLVPPLLAAELNWSFFGRAQAVDGLSPAEVVRAGEAFEERLAIETSLIVSVTNDRRLQLRKPLIKNVMLARHLVVVELEPLASAPTACRLDGVRGNVSDRAAGSCRMLNGSPEQQAHMIASLLWEAAT